MVAATSPTDLSQRLGVSARDGIASLYRLLVRARRRARDLLELNSRYLVEWKAQRRALAELDDRFWVGLRERVSEGYPCYFVLSTGRCGTQLLTRILRRSDRLVVHHSPEPELAVESVRAYESARERPDFFAGVVTGARAEMVEATAITGRTFVETNPKITFLAPQVRDVFLGARFVHLIRDPVDFVRSAVARGYYQSHRTERRHIRPAQGEVRMGWARMTSIQKTAWCWAETNAFIDRFAEQLSEDRLLRLTSEDLFSDPRAALRIADFCGAELDVASVEGMLRRKVNKSLSTGSVTGSRRELMDRILAVSGVETVARRHGYLR